MSIVSSVIQSDRSQADGRRKIVEAHTDHVGGIHRRQYMAAIGDNVQAGLTAAAAVIETTLASDEVNNNVGSIEEGSAVTTFVHSTVGLLRTALRERFRNARGIILANLAEFCLTLTNAQLQSLFGVSAGAETTALRARLQAKVDKRNSLRAEVGE